MLTSKNAVRVRAEKGQSLMELAVGIVVLLILVAGIVDLGRLLFFYIALRDAAQEGAVYGQLNPRSCDQIGQRVNNYLGASSGYLVNVRIKAPAASTYANCSDVASNLNVSCSGSDLQVEVNAPFKFAMPFMGGTSLNLQTTVNATILRPICGS